MPTHEEYWESLQAGICAKCIDGDGRGNCRIGNEETCALKRFLPEIVEVVESTYSGSMDPYVEALRKKVCTACLHQSFSGSCSLRKDLACALDRYYPLIVQVIEETRLQERLRKA